MERRCDKRGRGGFRLFAALDGFDRERSVCRSGDNSVYIAFGFKLGLFVVRAVIARGEACFRRAAVKMRVQKPVFFADKCLYLFLAVNHHARCNRLHAPCAQALFHLAPKKRRELIAHDAVEYAPRLLRVNQVLVDCARVFYALGDNLFRNLVESDALCLAVIKLQKLLEMPRNRLALAVRVGREVDGGRAFRILFKLTYKLALILNGDILRLKAVFDIHAHFALGQVAQVPHRGLDLILSAQVFFYSFSLCR